MRIGKYVDIRLGGSLDDASARVRDMCEKLLANQVIEDFRFEIGDGGAKPR